MPNLPTAPEQGTTGAESYTWSAILLPKGAPAAIVTRLNGAIGCLENLSHRPVLSQPRG
jgi:tripartite-type tricarboxylate transporter receptor subunit TctC